MRFSKYSRHSSLLAVVEVGACEGPAVDIVTNNAGGEKNISVQGVEGVGADVGHPQNIEKPHGNNQMEVNFDYQGKLKNIEKMVFKIYEEKNKKEVRALMTPSVLCTQYSSPQYQSPQNLPQQYPQLLPQYSMGVAHLLRFFSQFFKN